jgi:tRNA (guanine37-N1)-methyltransferase
VTGDPQSTVTESFEDGLLEAPHYTRPREFRGLAVPEVLLGGDHAAIERWRHEQARKITEERRADLLFSSHEKGPRTRSTTTEGKPWIE